MLLIGSKALIHHIGKSAIDRYANGGSPRDTDVIGTHHEFQLFCDGYDVKSISSNGTKVVLTKGSSIVEFEIAWPGSTGEALIQYVAKHDVTSKVSNANLVGFTVPSLDVLLAIKLTHRFAPQKAFHKTMADIRLLRATGAKPPQRLAGWMESRQKEVLAKHPKLNVIGAEFFNPKTVNYVYDHDSIHRAVAHADQPAYVSFLKPGCEVQCSEELFNSCSMETRINSVVEESYVLAIERSHVPFGTLSEEEAFKLALTKVCTTVTSGWWRTFAWENYHKVLQAYRPGYFNERFAKALDAGKILPFTGKKY